MTSISIFGPNLNDQSKGQFHVHAAGCGDCKHYGRGKFGGETGWHIDAESQLDVCSEIYADHLSDYGLSTEDAEGVEMLTDWLSDLWFAPCLSLPEKSVTA
jgi:hypothetical protein